MALFPTGVAIHWLGRLSGSRLLVAVGAGVLSVSAWAPLVSRPRVSRPRRAVAFPTRAMESSAEVLLDAAVENTFPASDPVSVQCAYEMASRRTDG